MPSAFFSLALSLALGAAPALQAPLATPVNCLLLSGQVHQGRLSLDPVFVVRTHPTRPEPGDYRLELLDAQGGTLLQTAFTTYPVAEAATRDERSFAFALPVTCRVARTYQGLRVSGPDGLLVSRFAGLGAAPVPPTATRQGPGQVRVQWNASSHPAALIRDPASLEVLALGRGGQLQLTTTSQLLEIYLSDGVRSQRFQVAVN